MNISIVSVPSLDRFESSSMEWHIATVITQTVFLSMQVMISIPTFPAEPTTAMNNWLETLMIQPFGVPRSVKGNNTDNYWK